MEHTCFCIWCPMPKMYHLCFWLYQHEDTVFLNGNPLSYISSGKVVRPLSALERILLLAFVARACYGRTVPALGKKREEKTDSLQLNDFQLLYELYGVKKDKDINLSERFNSISFSLNEVLNFHLNLISSKHEFHHFIEAVMGQNKVKSFLNPSKSLKVEIFPIPFSSKTRKKTVLEKLRQCNYVTEAKELELELKKMPHFNWKNEMLFGKFQIHDEDDKHIENIEQTFKTYEEVLEIEEMAASEVAIFTQEFRIDKDQFPSFRLDRLRSSKQNVKYTYFYPSKAAFIADKLKSKFHIFLKDHVNFRPVSDKNYLGIDVAQMLDSLNAEEIAVYFKESSQDNEIASVFVFDFPRIGEKKQYKPIATRLDSNATIWFSQTVQNMQGQLEKLQLSYGEREKLYADFEKDYAGEYLVFEHFYINKYKKGLKVKPLKIFSDRHGTHVYQKSTKIGKKYQGSIEVKEHTIVLNLSLRTEDDPFGLRVHDFDKIEMNLNKSVDSPLLTGVSLSVTGDTANPISKAVVLLKASGLFELEAETYLESEYEATNLKGNKDAENDFQGNLLSQILTILSEYKHENVIIAQRPREVPSEKQIKTLIKRLQKIKTR